MAAAVDASCGVTLLLLTALLMRPCRGVTDWYIITNVAGDVNIAATSASLNYPSGVALDSSGNVYIADRSNERIRKVAVSTGIITTIAGTGYYGSYGDGGAATSASLNYPYGVALDSSGNVYIADSWNERIRKVAVSTGIITTIAGTGSYGSSGDGGDATSASLYSPSGVALDKEGLVVTEMASTKTEQVCAVSSHDPLSTLNERYLYWYSVYTRFTEKVSQSAPASTSSAKTSEP